MDKTLLSYTRHFLSGTLLSRLSGFLRDVCMAFAFGDIPEIAALILSYRLCMLLRRVLGEGSMQSAFIPGYQSIKEKDPALALDFFKQIFFKWVLGIITLCLILGTTFFYLKPLFNTSWQQVIDLSIRLLPCLVCIIGYTLFQALLQCHGRYFMASVAPTLANILWAAGCLYSKNLEPARAMQTLTLFMCLGFFLQWIILLPDIKKIVPGPVINFKWKTLSSTSYGFNFFTAVALAAIGISATQINSALDGVFAKFADPKGPIHLWFSIRIQQLPLALLSIGLISAASPKLCQLIHSNQKQEAQSLIQSVITKLSILMMFITCGVICVQQEIISFLFERGMFSHNASAQTSKCLLAYMLGLVPTSLATIYASFYYALKEYKKPSQIAVYCLIANLVLNTIMVFVFHCGAWSVAAATSVCSFLNAYLLKRALAQEHLVHKAPLTETLYPYLSALIAACLLYLLKLNLPPMPTLVALSFLGLSYLGLYLLSCRLLNYSEPLKLFASFLPQKQTKTL